MSPTMDPPRPPLTDQERLWLTDKKAFAEAAALGPVVLRDRTVEELEIEQYHIAAAVLVQREDCATSGAAALLGRPIKRAV